MEALAASNQPVGLDGMEWLTPERLQQPYAEKKDTGFYPGPYGLRGPIWDKVRNHPLFVNHVENACQDVEDQIKALKNYEADHPKGFKHSLMKAVSGFGDIQNMANQVKRETGYGGDWQDIAIAAQRHPKYLNVLKQRDEVQQKRDNLEVM